MSESMVVRTFTLVEPRWITMRRDGKEAWLDMIDGKFAFGGDLEPSAAATVFLDELGHLIEKRIQEAAAKLAQNG